MNSKARAPQTKEEWEKRQSYIRREIDPESGRIRLFIISLFCSMPYIKHSFLFANVKY